MVKPKPPEERIGTIGTCSKCGKEKKIFAVSTYKRNIDEGSSGHGSTDFLCEDCF